MKYRRLKTLDSTSTPVMRYYKLKDGETPPYCNCFYGLTDEVASKIEGEVGEGVELIGFSHGGNNLAKGLILLDINTTPVYMGILGEDDEERPQIGEIVNGYQRVIDTHYDGDEDVDGKNDFGWGVETLDNPYYLFVIIQPEGTPAAENPDDSDAGEISPSSESTDGGHGRKTTVTITFDALGGSPEPDPQVIERGGKATQPADDPVDAHGGTFTGWVIHGAGDEPVLVDFDTQTFDEDTTLDAKYEY